MQMQCMPVPLIWQPGVFVNQPPANFVALNNGLLGSWPLATYVGTAATGRLTLAVPPTDGETVTIGAITYTWRDAPALDYDVGTGDIDSSRTNLETTINGGLLGPAHPDVSAAVDGSAIVVTALDAGLAGNGIATTETMAGAGNQWAAASTSGGVDSLLSLTDLANVAGPLNSMGRTYSSENPFGAILGSANITSGGIKNMQGFTTFTVTGWVQLNTKAAGSSILAFKSSGGTTQIALSYSAITDRFALDVTQTPVGVGVNDADVGSPAVGTWYFVLFWYDPADLAAGFSVTPYGAAALNPGVQLALTHALPAFTQFTVGAAAGALAALQGKLWSVSAWYRLLNAREKRHVFGSTNYPWPVFTPADGRGTAPATPTAPSAVLLTGSGPITVSFTDNTDGRFEHEVWRDDGTALYWELLTTLDRGDTSYDDADGTPLNSYKVRSIGRGEPSAFASASGAQAAILAETGELLTTEGGDTIIQE